MTFFSAYIGGKTSHAVNDAVNAIVAHDPTGATEAQLKMMEQDLDKAGQALAAAHQQFDHDSAEQHTIVELLHQRMAAAEYLQTQMDETTDPVKKGQLEKSLTTMMDMLEHMVPEVKHASDQAASAQEFLTMLQGAYETKGQQLKAARDGLQEAQRDMARSAQEKVIADQRAEAARQAAGFSGATNSLNTALKAMQDTAAHNRAEAEAANSKAHLLAPTEPEKDDSNIVAAMRAASGQGAAPTSLSDRLAALKASQA
jgi:hypothetical protein